MKLAAVGDNCMDVYDNTGEVFPGGNPVNVAVYYVRLGGEASYTGAVGTDEYGDLMVKAISRMNVDTSHVHFLSGNTAITHVELVDGERQLGDYDEGVLSKFKLTDEDIEFICTHDLVVSGLWGNVEDYFPLIRTRNVKIAFDAATRPEDPIAIKAIPNINYLFFASDGEDTELLRSLMKDIYSKGPELVVVTLGEKGSIAYDGNRFFKYGIVPCQVVDSMGAGDSYIAGFLKGILEKKEILECMEMGAGNASETLGYTGAW